MIARITRLLLALQLLVACGAVLSALKLWHADPASAALLGIALVLALRLLVTANNFSLAWRYRSETPGAFRLGPRQACALFFGEYKATMLASSWTMPFRAFARKTAPAPATLPVLLIHGYGCNSGYWQPMSKALTHAGISHYAIDMEPVACGIDEYVPLIEAAIDRMFRETGQRRVVIVAHSMGGLAARAYLRVHGAERIARIITLGTPHHGTALARFGIGLNTAQMRWIAGGQEGRCSEWLRELAARENQAVRRLFVSLYSHHDNIIAPQTSSRLPGAKNIAFRGIGHVALASHPAVQAQVVREIVESGTVSTAIPTSGSGDTGSRKSRQ